VLDEHFPSCTNSSAGFTEALSAARTLSVLHELAEVAHGGIWSFTNTFRHARTHRQSSRSDVVLHEVS